MLLQVIITMSRNIFYQMSSHLHLHPAVLFSWWNPSNWSWPTEFGAPQSWAWCWSGLPAGSPPHRWCSSHWHCVGCSPKSGQRERRKKNIRLSELLWLLNSDNMREIWLKINIKQIFWLLPSSFTPCRWNQSVCGTCLRTHLTKMRVSQWASGLWVDYDDSHSW